MSETLEILEKINTFYSAAFGQLVTYTIGVLAFVGILIPCAISILQSRQFTRDQKAHLDHISSEIEKAKTVLNEQLQADVNALTKTFETQLALQEQSFTKQIKLTENSLKGRTSHLQALAHCDIFEHQYGVMSAIWAMRSYAIAKDESNLLRASEILLSAFPRLNKKDLAELNDLERELEALFGYLDELNTTGRYSDMIIEIKKGYRNSQAREPIVIAAK